MKYETARGVEVPALGLGTWQLTGRDCTTAVETALEVGYRHIDTAQAYGNEAEVGEGIAAADVDREEIFLTTKLDTRNRTYQRVVDSTRESLDKLGTGYVDLLLIHQPNYLTRADHEQTLRAMADLVEEGLVRHVGVSNFGVEKLKRAREVSDVPILTDQVQYHPYWDQRKLLDYCRVHDVLLTAYSPLARGSVLNDPILERIGTAYDKSPAQVALRWLLQQDGVVTIPKATSREHIEANLDVFDFELTDAEMREIRQPSKLRTAAAYLRSMV
ncbi:aldo/keto reductase [Halapricum desulfuricans]|uniref:Aldo/keto reductase, related to diketogulonate reductase n=1 Tax=Halapricum desulfuricans TaxID=2841257 RepID=A0A897NMK4_9EURY|nr:aldo/keto reductase [Halapricum desulfuricans]QSG13664.1 Aldo/keto reductase, related to diketogulonate reductase [Halapricum desulfuricans]